MTDSDGRCDLAATTNEERRRSSGTSDNPFLSERVSGAAADDSSSSRTPVSVIESHSGRPTIVDSNTSTSGGSTSQGGAGPSVIPATNSTIERQSSTSSNRSDGGGGGGGERDRRFRFNLDIDASRRPLQALSMFQEWARNNVIINIPTIGGQQRDSDTLVTERARQTIGFPNDTQISVSPSSVSNDNVMGSTAVPSSSVALGFSSSARRPSVSSQRRGSSMETDPVPNASNNPSTSSRPYRESLTLDIEPNNWENNEVPGRNSRRESSDSRRTPHSDMGSPTANGDANTPSGQSGDLLRDSPETRAFFEELNSYTTVRPFVALMLVKSLVDHGSGIVCFLALFVTFTHANSLLKKEVSKQRKRNLLFLAMIAVNLVGCTGFIYYIFNYEELYYALVYMKTKVELNNFWMLIWVVGVTDYIAKFGAIITKSVVVAMPAALVPFQKRGIYYLFIEQTSQLYRSLLPAHHWLLYLLNSYEGNMKMFGLILAAMYGLFKVYDSIQRIKDWKSALKKLFQNVHYGTTLTQKDLDGLDSVVCPICHDTFTTPTRLSCTHVFCEECVSTWFDRERTCPMCRAKVVDDPAFRDGTTAQYIQFF